MIQMFAVCEQIENEYFHEATMLEGEPQGQSGRL
jgi:hypothetical protein